MTVRVAVFCTPEPGHFQLLRPLIAGMVQRGLDVRVYSDSDYENQVLEAGAEFDDLFGRYPVDSADKTSIPIPCRYVSYAAHYAGDIASDVKSFRPSLIICETFSLIGRVVAELLDIPWINVSPGHNLNPSTYARQLEGNPLLTVSEECHRAVAWLTSKNLVADASPFSYVTSHSPVLNICCEPPTFLNDSERKAFEPLEFFGSISEELLEDSPSRQPPLLAGEGKIKVYASFGRIVWRYYRQEALAALQAISAFLSSGSDFVGLISLGDHPLDETERASLESTNVRVEASVNQLNVLNEVDVFITHHGINSTHEAIVSRVPMLSYPFFWDQPSLAAKCREMGIAVPLSGTVRGRLTEEAVGVAMQELLSNQAQRAGKLERARNDELDVVRNRDVVFQRIIDLASQ